MLLKYRHILIFLILSSFILSGLQWIKINRIKYAVSTVEDQVQQHYQLVFLKHKNLADLIFNVYINTSEILSLYEKISHSSVAEQQKIRQDIHAKLSQHYQYFTNFKIRHFHFHLPSNHSFLRMHSPNHFGDDLSELRPSIQLTNQLKTPVNGFELGRHYAGYRFIYPLFSVKKKKHLGSMGISFSEEKFENELFSRMSWCSNTIYTNNTGAVLPKNSFYKNLQILEKNGNYLISKGDLSHKHSCFTQQDISKVGSFKKLITPILKNPINSHSQFSFAEQFNTRGEFTLVAKIELSNPKIRQTEHLMTAFLRIEIPMPQVDIIIQNNHSLMLGSLIILAIILFLIKLLSNKNLLQRDLVKLQSQISGINSGIATVDHKGNYLSVNHAYIKLLGYSEDEYLLTNCLTLTRDEEKEASLLTLQDAINGVPVNRVTHHCIHKSGRTIPLEISISKIKNSNFLMIVINPLAEKLALQKSYKKIKIKNKETSILNATLDGKVKLRTQELEKQTQRANHANKAKSAFLANMSHELRTPMHGIISFANMGIDHPERLTQEVSLKYFGYIKISADRLMDLLNDLLDLAKLEAGKMDMNMSQGSLYDTAVKCISEQQARLTELNISIIWHPDSISGDAKFDATRIGQVITNYLSNAIKFTPQGQQQGQQIEIRIAPDKSFGSDPALLFSMRDHGKGIPIDENELIFNKFEQGSRSVAGVTGGTGLGLPICKEIITAHKGKLWAKNHADGGAVFYFIIPMNHVG